MLFSAMLFCYVMGTACGIAANMDPAGVAFHNTMDQLNHFMRDRGLSKSMKIKLRLFFHNTKEMQRTHEERVLMSKMSPLMQGVVALHANTHWIDRVWYLSSNQLPSSSCEEGLQLRAEHKAFVAHIALKLERAAFVSQESLPEGQLFVLRRGLIAHRWRIISAGKCWGEDMIIDNPELIDHSPAVALTHVETLFRCFSNLANIDSTRS